MSSTQLLEAAKTLAKLEDASLEPTSLTSLSEYLIHKDLDGNMHLIHPTLVAYINQRRAGLENCLRDTTGQMIKAMLA